MQIFTSVKISRYTEIFICIVYIPLQGHRALPILATAVSGRQTHQYTGLVLLGVQCIIEGLRTRVDQPKIKYRKLHELHTKKKIKKYKPCEHVVRNLKFLNCSASSEVHFKSIVMLGMLTQHLWVRPLWFSTFH